MPFTKEELDTIADALATHADKVRAIGPGANVRLRELADLRSKVIKLQREMP